MREATAPTPQQEQVQYWAVSIFHSKTFWVNTAALLVALLSLTEIAVLVPQKYIPIYSAILAALNIFLRTQTIRPVAFIAPGDVKPISVPKIDSQEFV